MIIRAEGVPSLLAGRWISNTPQGTILPTMAMAADIYRGRHRLTPVKKMLINQASSTLPNDP